MGETMIKASKHPAFLAALALGAVAPLAQAATYAAMAPLAQYLISDRAEEVALARSAAPAAISNAATVMVLTRTGYVTAAKGTNGFVCLVERAWMSPFDAPGFWNPKTRGPDCYNPAAARFMVPIINKRTALVLSGATKPQILAAMTAAAARRELPRPEAGAMTYMMSRQQVLGDSNGPWHPHLMFITPAAKASAWGANVAHSPVILDDSHTQTPEADSIFMIPVGAWSDGTPAASGVMHH